MASSDIKGARGGLTPQSLYVPLPRPPTAFSLTVRKLLGRVEDGSLRVPTFQRPLRWTADDVVKLFDSLLKGYPVGSLLFWKQPLPADAHVRIGSAEIDAGAVSDGWFIVDGQQRTTALAASLLALDQRGDRRWDVYFDPNSSAIMRGPIDEENIRRHVPLHTLGDLRRLGRWLRDCDLNEELQQRVENVQQRLLDYELPAYLMETDDVDALRGVFARLNSTGVRMRADEVFHALLGSHSDTATSGRRAVDFGELQKAADVEGFGEPPRNEVLKAVLAMSGLDPTRRLDDLGDAAIGRIVHPDDAAEALRRTVSFLQASPEQADEPGAGVPAYAFLPYPVVFALLARWFHLFPSPDNATRRELSHWLWRGVANAVHQRAAVSAMRLQVRQIEDGDMGGSIRRLLETVGEPSPGEWSLDPFHMDHAASRVEILALLSRMPRDRRGPISWRSLVSSGQRVAREIFRVSAFPKGRERELARTAANRVLLDVRPTDLQVELKKWDWDSDREALESQLVDQAGLDELRLNDAEKFVARRASRVRSLVSRFIAQRAGLNGPRVLPASTYFEVATVEPTS